MTIPIAFLIIASLVGWFIIGTKGNWFLKAFCTSASLYFVLSIAYTLPALYGWPSDDPLPNKFEIYYVLVKEPNKVNGDDGEIYFWVREIEDLSQDNKDEEEGISSYLIPLYEDKSGPRGYRVPYSTELHKRAEQIAKDLAEGKRMMGTNNGKGGGKKGGKEGEGQQTGGKGQQNGNGGGGSFSNSPEISFQELPPPSLPEK